MVVIFRILVARRCEASGNSETRMYFTRNPVSETDGEGSLNNPLGLKVSGPELVRGLEGI